MASELPLGSYSVTVEKEGFRTTTLTGIPVSVGSPARADVKLDTGAVQEASRSHRRGAAGGDHHQHHGRHALKPPRPPSCR